MRKGNLLLLGVDCHETVTRAAREAGALGGHKRAAEAVTQVCRAGNIVLFLLAVDSGSHVVFCDKDGE